MATSGLRPLGIGEILDAGIKVVTRHWKPLVLCTGGIVAPFAVINVLILLSINPETIELIPENSSADPELPEAATLVAIGVVGVMSVFALIVAYSACFKGVCDAWLGARPDAGQSIRYGLRRSGKVFLLGLVWLAFVSVAWIPCLVPLIWLGIAWSLSMPVLLFEGVGPFKALGRSYQLIKGRWWATLGIAAVCYVLVTIVSIAVQLPLLIAVEVVAGESPIANAVAQVLSYSVSFAITIPYYTAVLTILYFDQRVRKEAFDLQLIAESMGTVRDPNAPLPQPMIEDEYTPEQRAAAPYWPPPPGWVPPPASEPAAPPSEWSSPSGWTAPSPDPPLWGTDRREDDPPPPDDRPWSPPAAHPPGEEPPPSYPRREPGWAAPPAEDDSKPKPERDRADWQPPESPRGPGGL